MYRAVTRNIEVQVRPFYLEDRSDPSENRYVWGYQITIDNQSDEFVQLLSRYWHITDGTGRVEEVRGAGRRRRPARTQSRRQLSIHVGLPALDAVRDHGRALYDAQQARRDIRHRHPGVFAGSAGDKADGELGLSPRHYGEKCPAGQ